MNWKASTLTISLMFPSVVAAQEDFNKDPYFVTRVYTAPASGVPIQVTAGDAIATTKTDRLSGGAILLEDAVGKAQSVPKGALLSRNTTKTKYKACAISGEQCLIDDDGDGTFDRISRDFFDGAKPLLAKARYQIEPNGVVEHSPFNVGITRTILYQGVSAGTMKLSYREFTADGLARDAFSEDISIQLGEKFPQQFAVKGLIFNIIEITPLGMKLTLDSVAPDKDWPNQIK